jgi:excisionase family DNA binding protein
MDNKFFTIKEVAEMFRVEKETVYRLVYEGKIEAVKFGGSWRIPTESINKLMNENKNVATNG